MSPFDYNETVAQEFFPLSSTEAKEKNFVRMDINYDTKVPKGTVMLTQETLPAIEDATEEICNQIIQCSISGRPFRLTNQEFAYYKRYHLSLPHIHPDERHQKRRERT